MEKSSVDSKILQYARELRKGSTDVEKIVWEILRNRRFGGLKFRRQYPEGKYILDFYCHERKIAIELDGGQHADGDQQRYDNERTRILSQKGITILRFWDNDILNNIDGVLQRMWETLSPHPDPLPEGEGEGNARWEEGESRPNGEGRMGRHPADSKISHGRQQGCSL